MRTWVKIGLGGAAAAAAAVLVFFVLPRDGGSGPREVAAGGASPAPTTAEVVAVTPPIEGSRALVAVGAPEEPPAATTSAAPDDGIPGLRAGGPPDARPAIHVFDALDGSPIELVHVSTQTPSDGYPRDGGTFRAPGGLLTRGGQPTVFWMSSAEPFRLTIWAEGYEPSVVVVPDFRAPRLVEVPLQPGATPLLRGRVVRAGVPVAGATVSLNPFYDLQWELEDLEAAAAQRTNADGSFALSAPAGSWILRVRTSTVDHARRIALPFADELIVDLGDLAALEVTARDAGDEPLASQMLLVRRSPSDGRQRWSETNGAGAARFVDLQAGAFEITLHGPREHFQNTPRAREEVVLAPGESRAVTLTTGPEAHDAWLVVEGGGNPAEWSARGFAETGGWHEIASDGLLSIDVSDHSWIDLRSPEAAIWRWAVPSRTPDERPEIRVPGDPPAYRGRLSDRLTGKPITDGTVRVQFRSGSDEGELVSVRALARPDGRFVLPLLADEIRGLTFELGGHPVGSDRFVPHDPPSRAGELDIRLFRHTIYQSAANAPSAVVTGTVTDAVTGEPMRAAFVRVTARLHDLDGVLYVGWDRSNGRTATDGTFRVEVPAADGYELRAWEEWTQEARTVTEEHGGLAAGMTVTWDLAIP